MKKLILARAPVWFQNLAISLYNWRQWSVRRSGDYESWFSVCESASEWSESEWTSQQSRTLDTFLHHAVKNSNRYSSINPQLGLKAFPILEKETLIENLSDIATIQPADGIVSHTGGTTGASMKVIYTISDTQKRFATLDWFRSLAGWRLGKRTAWFSGKAIVRDRDLASGKCFRDDWITATRFFSTFHINERNFDIYWKALIEFNPEFIVGFPSSLSELLAIAREKGRVYPHKVKTFFPTAETVLPYHRDLVMEVLGATTRDQYASSEGAPFIVECEAGNLHILPYTGIFEVIDENGNPARSGELLVTAFHTHGTPLIRYRVGDRISLAPTNARCECNWSFPLVESIEGRNTDFVWSPERGRINLGNLSNATKEVAGLIAFRVLQNVPDKVVVEVQTSSKFDEVNEARFVAELQERLGDKMSIEIFRCARLDRKKSGKLRIVENTLNEDEMILN